MSPDGSNPGPVAAPKRRPRIIDVSTLTAVAGLAVALIFNAVQVHDSAKQERETRQATQLELLTELNGLVAPLDTKVIPRSPEFLHAEFGSGRLSTQANTNFAATLANLNYLAWLLNNGFIAIPGARQFWSHSMDCAYASALLIYPSTVRARLRSLDRLVHPGSTKASWRRLWNANC